VLRKRRGTIGRDLLACIETVAGMSRRVAFGIDLSASGCRYGKNRLPSASRMAKIGERWRDDHRHTRIRGRR
jgi:hypothetical protein